MILPILISVSVAPGSYFFCALAVVADIATIDAAIAATTTRLLTGTGIISSAAFYLVPDISAGILCASFASRSGPCKRRLVPLKALIPSHETALLAAVFCD